MNGWLTDWVFLLYNCYCFIATVSFPPKWKIVVIALHKSTPLTPMCCQCVTVDQLFDSFKYCITAWCYMMTISAGIHSWMCIFLSTDTNIFCISLSFPFICLFFCYFTLPCFSHPSIPFCCFHCLSMALLCSLITLLMRLPSPVFCTLQFLAFLPFPISSFLPSTVPCPILPTLLPPLSSPFLSSRLL